MITRISFLIFSSFFFSTLLAQQSINSGGNKANGATGSVNYSVGQVFYHHLNNDNYQIHEGVQYGYEIINSIGENNTIELKYNVYPNPTNTKNLEELESVIIAKDYDEFEEYMNNKNNTI